MKKILLALAVAGAAVSAQADVKLSGWVNYVAGDVEDINGESDFAVQNANTSKSRFRILSSTEADGITYGSAQEFGVNTGGTLDVRKNEIYIKGDFGKISLGQGSEAGDGATEQSYSRGYVVNDDHSSFGGNNAGFSVVDPARTERLRYDAKVGAVAFAIDLQDDDDITGAVNFKGENVKGSLYYESRDANDSDEIGGSIAIKSGPFNASFRFANIDAADSTSTVAATAQDREFRGVILAYTTDKYTFSVDKYTNELETNTAGDTETTGLGVVYRPTKGVELYTVYREFNDNNNSSLDGDGFLFGGRVKF